MTEPSNFNLPIGTKDRIKDAMALMRTSSDEEPPANMKEFVVAAINEKIAAVQAAAQSARRKPSR